MTFAIFDFVFQTTFNCFNFFQLIRLWFWGEVLMKIVIQMDIS
jgi:hypothetical protein